MDIWKSDPGGWLGGWKFPPLSVLLRLTRNTDRCRTMSHAELEVVDGARLMRARETFFISFTVLCDVFFGYFFQMPRRPSGCHRSRLFGA